ncbi:hypothetical protein V2J09_007687 [Rumex salicifolius]
MGPSVDLPEPSPQTPATIHTGPNPTESNKSWREVVAGGVEQTMKVIDKAFLKDKIVVSMPDAPNEDLVVTIAEDVMVALSSVWDFSVVVKLLGQSLNFLTMDRKLREIWKSSRLFDGTHEGPVDHLLTLCGGDGTQTFAPPSCFTPTWVRILDLHIHLYEEQVLLSAAIGIGQPIRVDTRTLNAHRGRFARVCIEVDVERPLKGTIVINESRFLLEYEGLPTICYGCGRFGHVQAGCPYRPETSKGDTFNVEKPTENKTGALTVVLAPDMVAPTRKGVHGEWMD